MVYQAHAVQRQPALLCLQPGPDLSHGPVLARPNSARKWQRAQDSNPARLVLEAREAPAPDLGNWAGWRDSNPRTLARVAAPRAAGFNLSPTVSIDCPATRSLAIRAVLACGRFYQDNDAPALRQATPGRSSRSRTGGGTRDRACSSAPPNSSRTSRNGAASASALVHGKAVPHDGRQLALQVVRALVHVQDPAGEHSHMLSPMVTYRHRGPRSVIATWPPAGAYASPSITRRTAPSTRSTSAQRATRGK